MINNCFNLGIRLCPTCGDSDDYVDDIPSISHNLLSALKESDVQKFSTFFTQIKNAAYIRFKKDIEIKFNEGKKFNHILSETNPFSISSSHTLLSNHDIIGYYTKLPYHQFVEYHLNKLGFYAHTAGDVELFVIDMVTQDVSHKQTITLKKGINTIKIGAVISNEYQTEVFVGIKPITAVLSAMKCGDLHDCDCSNILDGCSCQQEDCDTCCETDLYGTIEECEVYKKANIKRESVKYFCLDASLKCSFEKMICEYSEYFQEAYKYLVASLILKHKINSYERGWYADANNQVVTDVTIPEIEEYYYKLLSLSVSNIKDITNDSVCWACSDTPKRPLMASMV